MAGAQLLNYHEVVDLIIEGDGAQRVAGAHVRDVARGEEVEIRAQMTKDYVVHPALSALTFTGSAPHTLSLIHLSEPTRPY